jgi:hypothetical protein
VLVIFALGGCQVSADFADAGVSPMGGEDAAGGSRGKDGGTGGGSHDLAMRHPGDLAGQPPADLALVPITGSVGTSGGQVSRLFFGVSGDARPTMCNETYDYPTGVLNSIYQQMAAANVQFAVDTGDHMFVCQNGAQSDADNQMNLYVSATQLLGAKPTFLTLGNHDCVSMTNPSYCSINGFTTVNFTSFMNALSSISQLPYYSFDVTTSFGLARFVIIADNAWSSDQDTWLNQTLSDAQQNAKYIFVFRHHPLDNTDMPDFQHITQIIQMYRHTAVIVGHTHEMRLDHWNDPSGRTFIVGNAGAPLATNFTWNGYMLVEQLNDTGFSLRFYDASSGNQMNAYMVAP